MTAIVKTRTFGPLKRYEIDKFAEIEINGLNGQGYTVSSIQICGTENDFYFFICCSKEDQP